jgi:hypothetical protein
VKIDLNRSYIMAKFRKWHDKAIDWACCSKSLIEQVAQELGVPARAIVLVQRELDSRFI